MRVDEIKARTAKLESELAQQDTKQRSYKIVSNGSFGVLGSKYSFMYAPHLLLAVTLTGQLALLMLIERAYWKGIPAISANTDGVEFYCPVRHYRGLNGDRILSGLS